MAEEYGPRAQGQVSFATRLGYVAYSKHQGDCEGCMAVFLYGHWFLVRALVACGLVRARSMHGPWFGLDV